MLRNYITTTLRRLWRQPGYALLNVGGLAVGLAVLATLLTVGYHAVRAARTDPARVLQSE